MSTLWKDNYQKHPLLKGVTINAVVLIDDNFVVVIGKYNDVFWATVEQYDKQHNARPEIDRVQHRAGLNEAALLESSPTEGLDEQTIERFKRLLGEAIVCGLEYDFANARRMLVAASEYIVARSQEKSRFWYLCACFAMVVPFALIGCALWLARQKALEWLGSGAFWVVIDAIAGSLGALFSVIVIRQASSLFGRRVSDL